MHTVDEVKIAALKHEIAAGIEDFTHGRFQVYNETNLMQLADDISRSGRIRLHALRLKVAAKVQNKRK